MSPIIVPVLITVFTVVAVYYLDRWEQVHVQSIFDWVPAILLAYLIPAGISWLLGQDYSGSDIHQLSKTYFIPLAIIAVMSSLSIRQLRSIGWRPIAVFVIGSCWIAIFPIFLAFVFMDSLLVSDLLVEQDYWKGLPPIVGSWIGGSTSQLVLKELVECPENVFLTILVLDNILVNIWTILMFQGIKKSNSLNKLFNISNLSMPDEIHQTISKTLPAIVSFSILLLSVILINVLLDSFVAKIVVLSIVGLIYSNLIKAWNFDFALKFGSILILIVMAVLGLKLRFDSIQFDAGLLGFLVVWLVSHFVIMLLAAKLMNVNLAWVPIASMANVGGIATAPAVTAAYEKKWMPHAIVLAILSMATGTFWGMLTIFLFRAIVL